VFALRRVIRLCGSVCICMRVVKVVKCAMVVKRSERVAF